MDENAYWASRSLSAFHDSGHRARKSRDNMKFSINCFLLLVFVLKTEMQNSAVPLGTWRSSAELGGLWEAYLCPSTLNTPVPTEALGGGHTAQVQMRFVGSLKHNSLTTENFFKIIKKCLHKPKFFGYAQIFMCLIHFLFSLYIIIHMETYLYSLCLVTWIDPIIL